MIVSIVIYGMSLLVHDITSMTVLRLWTAEMVVNM